MLALLALQKSVSSILVKYNKTIVKRVRKTSLEDAFAFNLFLASTNNQKNAVAKVTSFENKNVSVRAITKRSYQIPDEMLDEMEDLLKQNNSKLFNVKKDRYTVDGSKITLPKALEKYNFPYNTNELSTKGYIMGIYEITKKNPETMQLYKSHNERKAIIDFITANEDRFKGSILIFDRGYYSFALEKFLKEKGIHYIFRLPKHLKLITDSLKEKTIGDEINENKRLVKYVIKSNCYYILTDLVDQNEYPVESFIEMYHERWQIEEYYKYSKNNLNLDHIKLQNLDSIRKTIRFNLIIGKLVYFIQNLYEQSNPKCQNKKYIVNKGKITTGLFQTEFLLNFIYGKDFENALKTFEKYYIDYITSSKGKSFPIVCANRALKSYNKFHTVYERNDENILIT
jgi:hypothetical protein